MRDCASCQAQQAQPPSFLAFPSDARAPWAALGWTARIEPRSVCDLWARPVLSGTLQPATCCSRAHQRGTQMLMAGEVGRPRPLKTRMWASAPGNTMRHALNSAGWGWEGKGNHRLQRPSPARLSSPACMSERPGQSVVRTHWASTAVGELAIHDLCTRLRPIRRNLSRHWSSASQSLDCM